ncbi:hypothetical protein [Xanthobacter sp.]|uniref:hypothetical protein n=1 Tax=Xanthobacter sp. TaxID=35809 RepID=UPI0025FB94CB|nr:hypothetical protein [Xanthobacter sp.]
MKHVCPPEGAPVYSVAYGGPFMGVHGRFYAEHGPTIGELVALTPDLPAGFDRYGEVRISGHIVPRELWCWVRPKPSASGLPTYVTLHMAPRGPGGSSGGDGGKAIIGIVAALALTLATAGIASGFLAGATGAALTGGLFASGGALSFLGTGIGAQALALGVGLAGSLALGALTSAPTDTARTRKADNRGAASASGNIIAPGDALPRVIGSYRVFPALVNDAYYEIIDQDEFVTVVGMLAGPHKLEAIRIGDAGIEDADDIEYEVREGWDSDAALTLITKQSRITGTSVELSPHVLNPDSQRRLKHQSNPALDVPAWQTVATRHSPDRARVRLDFPQGLGSSASDSESSYAMMALRVEIRPRGATTWTVLPELWYSSRRTDAKKGEIVLDWTTEPGTVPDPPANKGFVYAFRSVPVQTASPAGIGGLSAHSYFSDPAKTVNVLQSGNTATTGVLHTHLTSDSATFYLDPDLFPKSTYEIRIRRSALVSKSTLTTSNYTVILTGVVYDYFGYYLDAGVYQVINDDDWFGSAYMLRCQSEWDGNPAPLAGDAKIVVRAKNRAIENVSVLASGYVPDITNLAAPWITTSNPAHHYRFVLAGSLNTDPLPVDLLDEDSLDDWRATCAAEGYQCNAIVQGDSVMDTLAMAAACGYARPAQSEVWGVYEDKDRSAEAPVQIFSPRNSSGLRWEKALPRLPDGWRITHPDKSADYEDQQFVVMRPGATGGNLEGVTYKGLVTRAEAQARGVFDLAQGESRSTFYYWNAPAEAIVCRRGSLVGLTHDVLTRQAGAGRVLAKTVSGGNITALTLDAAVEIAAGDPAFGIVIRRADGTFSTHPISNGVGEHTTVTLTTPIPDASVTVVSGWDTMTVAAVGEGADGAHVCWGPVDNVTIRVLIFNIERGDDDLTFALTAVDEAPELVRTAAGSYDPPGSVTYDHDGDFFFIVPNYETSLTVTFVGGSAGAYGISNASNFPAGTAGGDTIFDGMTAGGSPVPASHTSAVLGGVASGPGTSFNGNIGAAPTSTASGVGGDAVGTTGTGGTAVTADGNGRQGTAPGAGASGARRTISGTVYATGGTGSGALKQRTYARGDLVPGTVMPLTVGVAGRGGVGTSYTGGEGQHGQFAASWT